MVKSMLITIVVFITCTAGAQEKPSLLPGLSAIKKTELKSDLYELASDSFRGRRAGTIDELQAAAWVAKQARKAGLQPAGDNGTYFQFFPLHRTTIASSSTIAINDNDLQLWKDAWVTTPVKIDVDTTVTWLQKWADTSMNLNQKVVAMKLLPPAKMPAPGVSLWVYRYALSAIRQQSAILKRQGVKAIILVADSTAESDIGFFGHGFQEGLYQLQGAENVALTNTTPVILVKSVYGSALQTGSAVITADVRVNDFIYPSINVVAKAPGTHKKLKSEWVLFSGHHDHDGIGEAVAGDFIWNGADDNASVAVAMLAIGRAWVQHPAKRGALFVWHGAEERGLLGSKWYAQHLTVEKGSIVAVLNGDMIGRNSPDTAALLGTTKPHQNSKQLVDIAIKANRALTHFVVDTSWDAADHPENWYFRSDHLSYAQTNIPSIFFTSLLHTDYHTPKDEANRIDYDKLLKMTQWMYATGWQIGNNLNSPMLDK